LVNLIVKARRQLRSTIVSRLLWHDNTTDDMLPFVALQINTLQGANK
jgi:hypothetical protein